MISKRRSAFPTHKEKITPQYWNWKNVGDVSPVQPTQSLINFPSVFPSARANIPALASRSAMLARQNLQKKRLFSCASLVWARRRVKSFFMDGKFAHLFAVRRFLLASSDRFACALGYKGTHRAMNSNHIPRATSALAPFLPPHSLASLTTFAQRAKGW